MNCKLFRSAAAGLVSIASFLFGTSAIYGQDLLAFQAPIDRQLRAVDSLALRLSIEAEEEMAGLELYAESWNNDFTHCYSSELVPDSFKIDLRGFAMPTTSRKVTSAYGYRPRFRRFHYGLDVKVQTGDTIYAAFDGKVRIVRYEPRGYGKYVVIRHNNGLETIYAHFSKHLVSVDQEVKAGEPIGLGGNTGRSFGSHLHFETRLLGQPINPALLFDFAMQDVTDDYYVFHKENAPARNNSYYASNKKGGVNYYKVRKGDTLSSISKKLGVSVSRLRASNNLGKKSYIRANQVLKY